MEKSIYSAFRVSEAVFSPIDAVIYSAGGEKLGARCARPQPRLVLSNFFSARRLPGVEKQPESQARQGTQVARENPNHSR